MVIASVSWTHRSVGLISHGVTPVLFCGSRHYPAGLASIMPICERDLDSRIEPDIDYALPSTVSHSSAATPRTVRRAVQGLA
jgi:hypothetical protein